MNYYFFQEDDFNALINGYNFGTNSPVFTNVSQKHYISVDNWELWVSSKPNHDYVLSVFTEFATIETFVEGKFEPLTQSEYEAHIADLSGDNESFVIKERELCGLVSIQMAVVLNTKINNGEMTFMDGLKIQDLFGRQVAMTYNNVEDLDSGSIVPITDITVHISIFEYLEQMKSLGGAYERLRNTPIDNGIGFTQEIKDEFLALIRKQRIALNA